MRPVHFVQKLVGFVYTKSPNNQSTLCHLACHINQLLRKPCRLTSTPTYQISFFRSLSLIKPPGLRWNFTLLFQSLSNHEFDLSSIDSVGKIFTANSIWKPPCEDGIVREHKYIALWYYTNNIVSVDQKGQ